MSSPLCPIPVHGVVRNYIFPVFNKKQFTVLIGFALCCCAFGLVMRDAMATFVTLAIVYVSFLLTLWRDVPYKMKISANEVAAVEEALDKATFLERKHDNLVWKRRSALATSQDNITMVVQDGCAEIEARKRNVFRIKEMLDRKR